MPAIGFGLLWLSYTVGLYGYCTWKGYDVTWSQLIRPSKALTKWPPPAKQAAASTASTSSGTGVSLPNPSQIGSLIGEAGSPIGRLAQGGVTAPPPYRNEQ